MDVSAAPLPHTVAGPTGFLTSVLTSASASLTTAAPHYLDLRDDDGTPVLITQTLTRPEGIVISVVTLGNTPKPESTSTTSTTTTSVPPSTSPSGHNLTDAEIAAIIGSVVGFLILCLLLWCFCVVQRRKYEAWYAAHSSRSSSSSSSGYSESESDVEMVYSRPRRGIPVPVPTRPRSVHFQPGLANPRPPPAPVLNVSTTQYGRVSTGGPPRRAGVRG